MTRNSSTGPTDRTPVDNPGKNLSTGTDYRIALAGKGLFEKYPKAALLLRFLRHRSEPIPLLLHNWSPVGTSDLDLEAFAKEVTRHSLTGCWLFGGPESTFREYRSFRAPSTGLWHSAHRWIYVLLHGPLPEGLILDHRCEVPPCANPDHLQAVTSSDNRKLQSIDYRLEVEKANQLDCRLSRL